MSPIQFRSALDRLELSQLGAARLFGLGARTVRRYVSGEAEIPEPTAILLRLAARGIVTIEQIEAARK